MPPPPEPRRCARRSAGSAKPKDANGRVWCRQLSWARNNTPQARPSTGHDVLLDRRPRQPALARLHDEGLVERIPLALDVGRRRRFAGRMADVVADQGAGDAKLDVGLELVIVVRVDLRDQRLVALLEYQKVQMRGPKIVPPGGAHQIADRPVDRDRVARWL